MIRTIKSKVLALLGLMSVVIVALAASGWVALALNNGALRTVHDDRVVPLKQLKVVSDMYAVNIVDAAHKVRNGNIDAAAGLVLVDAAIAAIAYEWRSYTGTYLTPDEQRLVAETRRLMDAADRSVAVLRDLVAASDAQGLDRFVIGELYGAVDPVTEKLGELVDLQLRVAGEEFERAEQVFGTSQWLQMVLIAVGLIAIVAGAVIVLAGVIRPIGAMTDAMTRIARHDLDVVIPGSRQDEIGAMAAALEIFRENLATAGRLEAERRTSRERREKRQQEIERLIAGFDGSAAAAIGTLSSASLVLQQTAQSMAASAEETQRQATAVAAASSEASANVQSVASAAGQLAGSIDEIGRQVSESAQIAGAAAKEAVHANTQIQDLTVAVQKIGDVVKLINDIAGQTNLLALNATIEAARAGEAGKGFAVVASEVKSLANQTAQATGDIAQQVQGVQNATGAAVAAIANISAIVDRVSRLSSSIAAAVAEQEAATRDVACNVGDASKGAADVASNIIGITVAARESGKASALMLDGAVDVGRQGDAMRAEIDRFFAAIRVA